jgi:hypothetical protein
VPQRRRKEVRQFVDANLQEGIALHCKNRTRRELAAAPPNCLTCVPEETGRELSGAERRVMTLEHARDCCDRAFEITLLEFLRNSSYFEKPLCIPKLFSFRKKVHLETRIILK